MRCGPSREHRSFTSRCRSSIAKQNTLLRVERFRSNMSNSIPILQVWNALTRPEAIAYTTAALPDDGDAVFFWRPVALSSGRFGVVARHARRYRWAENGPTRSTENHNVAGQRDQGNITAGPHNRRGWPERSAGSRLERRRALLPTQWLPNHPGQPELARLGAGRAALREPARHSRACRY